MLPLARIVDDPLWRTAAEPVICGGGVVRTLLMKYSMGRREWNPSTSTKVDEGAAMGAGAGSASVMASGKVSDRCEARSAPSAGAVGKGTSSLMMRGVIADLQEADGKVDR